jgi:hypothetical protein
MFHDIFADYSHIFEVIHNETYSLYLKYVISEIYRNMWIKFRRSLRLNLWKYEYRKQDYFFQICVNKFFNVSCELLMFSIQSFQIFVFNEHWYQPMPAIDKNVTHHIQISLEFSVMHIFSLSVSLSLGLSDIENKFNLVV